MTAPDLTRLFESLVAPMPVISGNDLSAVPFPSAPAHRLGKDANGSPCLLIRQAAQAARSAPIRLENLFVSFDVPCTVRQPNGVQESDNFTIVRCTAGNPALFPHFLKIVLRSLRRSVQRRRKRRCGERFPGSSSLFRLRRPGEEAIRDSGPNC
jgi:hypothetical protein